jgi:ABC-type amino acid transport substrate-binding protein
MAHRRGWELAVDYSETYFLSGARILVTERSGISRLSHLKQKPIAVIDDSTTGGFTPADVIAVLPESDVVTASDLLEAMSLLESREVVGVVADLRTLMATTYDNEESEKYRIVTEPITTTPVGIMLPPDDDRLRERVNFALMNIFETGTYDEIAATWLREPFPGAVGPEFVMELWPE